MNVHYKEDLIIEYFQFPLIYIQIIAKFAKANY